MKRSLVLAALMMTAVCGYGDVFPPAVPPMMSQLQEVIEETILDPGRRRQLVVLGKEIDSRELDLERTVAEYAGKLAALNALYDVTRDQFDALDVEYTDRINAQRSRLAHRVIALQGATSKKEWGQIGTALATGVPGGFGLAAQHQLERFGKHLRRQIIATIPDPARQRRAAELAHKIDTELSGYERTLNETAFRVTDLVRRQDSTWAQFDWEFSGAQENWTGVLTRCIEVRFLLRDQINREEWKIIFAPRKEDNMDGMQ
jgi:hypothetical protein